jgi:hypothetical protein
MESTLSNFAGRSDQTSRNGGGPYPRLLRLVNGDASSGFFAIRSATAASVAGPTGATD